MEITNTLGRLIAGESLTAAEMEEVIARIMSGEVAPVQIAGLLVALRQKGESVDELAGAARAMRRFAEKVPTRQPVVDTCGTGGDASGTFNISTTAALIAAGAGLRVAKHGNRAMSGVVGGADVLEELGVRIDLSPERAAACLDEVGMAFLFAQSFHPAMRHVASVRRELGVRTIFNLLGPLSNPAGAEAQLLGVFSSEWLSVLAEALAELGSRRVMVVHGEDGLDEITLTAPTQVAELRDGAVRRYRLDPHDLGLALCSPKDLHGGDAATNAEIVRGVLAGRGSAAQVSITALNAAAALYVGDHAESMEEGLALARGAIESGAAQRVLDRLVEFTGA
jgi:anthranilate phosphoribosyltransferase